MPETSRASARSYWIKWYMPMVRGQERGITHLAISTLARKIRATAWVQDMKANSSPEIDGGQQVEACTLRVEGGYQRSRAITIIHSNHKTNITNYLPINGK